MSKTKKQKEARKPARYSSASKSKSKSKVTKPGAPAKKKGHQQHSQHSQPTIPFDVHDKILLVGEGDLSFTASLILNHGCANIVSTTFDTLPALLEKYPHASTHIATITENDQKLLHGIDATKLSSHKPVRTKAPYQRIIFNFPHTGGKSTDVNRQVRYNQELLASFFKAAIPLLHPSPDSSILVTLFEGEPYSLWNVRDLGRHVGLLVKRSFRFMADAYPTYRHGRTLGVVKGRDGSASETAWKGEGRAARTFEFGMKEAEGSGMGEGREVATGGNFAPLGKKRGKGESDSEDDSD